MVQNRYAGRGSRFNSRCPRLISDHGSTDQAEPAGATPEFRSLFTTNASLEPAKNAMQHANVDPSLEA